MPVPLIDRVEDPAQANCFPFTLSDHGVIRSDRVFDAMLATDRGLYSRDYPYQDSPQSIGIHISTFYTPTHTHTYSYVAVMYLF